METITQELQNVSFLKLVQWGASTAMVFGGVVPYIPQYRQIKRTENADGFSLHVCLALLVANILRILYWFAHGFELPLLAQSVVMIVAMFVMVKLCVKVRNRNQLLKEKDRSLTGGALNLQPESSFFDFDLNYFWKWTNFDSYIQCMLFFTAISTAALYMFHHSAFFVETIGVLAVFTESLLGVPQLLRNLNQRSTKGMSVGMVLMWLSGDSFKTLYFILRAAPQQFMAAGLLQVAVDLAIIFQVWLYGKKSSPHGAPSASVSRHKTQELVK